MSREQSSKSITNAEAGAEVDVPPAKKQKRSKLSQNAVGPLDKYLILKPLSAAKQKELEAARRFFRCGRETKK